MAVVDQCEIYAGLWRKFSEQIRNGQGVGDFRPEASQRVCTTIVSRLPQPVSVLLRRFIAPLASDSPEHYYHPASDYHFTLLDISPIAASGNYDSLPGAALSALSALARSLTNERPIRLSAKGLGVFPTTVFLQLLDIEGRVAELRERIRTVIAGELAIQLQPPLVDGVIFANVARFCRVPSPSVVDFVSAAREAPELEFEASEFEVVSTDKALSSPATIIHEYIQFSGPAEPGSSRK